MANEKIFDSVFRTMMQKTPQLIVPLVNEVFKRSYPLDERVIQLRNEHEGLKGLRITDSLVRLGDRLYHVECQSSSDKRMTLRMVEYDIAIALEFASFEGDLLSVEFPESCVIYLGDAPPKPLRARIVMPSGKSIEYLPSTFSTNDYSLDQIFDKQLLFMLPFYLMRYRGRFSSIAADDVRSDRLIDECASLRGKLQDVAFIEQDENLYDWLVELSVRISDYLLENENKLQEKVRAAMGGEILELMSDRIEAAEKEAAERGMERGLQQGLQQGLREGFTQGSRELAEKLQEFGVDQETLDRALTAVGCK